MIAFLLLSLLSWALTGCFRGWALHQGLLDIPNHRSSHQVETPRGGGVVFVLLFTLWSALAFYQGLLDAMHFFLLVPSAFCIALVGFWDDHHSLSAKIRLLTHMAVSLAFLVGLYAFKGPFSILGMPFLFSFVLSFFALVWCINLFNFMDGTDGLSSSEGIMIFLAAGFALQAQPLSTMAFALCAVLIGFLIWNWPKARIFMGDVGSGFLGFLIGAMAILSEVEYGLSIGYWLLWFALFWMDTTLTLFRRWQRGHKLWEAHRLHAYQRIHRSGFSHAKVLYSAIAINLLLLALSWMVFQGFLGLWLAVFLGICVLLGIYYTIEKRFSMDD